MRRLSFNYRPIEVTNELAEESQRIKDILLASKSEGSCLAGWSSRFEMRCIG
jgi:hypothetical protein